jgi:hypothetical protein
VLAALATGVGGTVAGGVSAEGDGVECVEVEKGQISTSRGEPDFVASGSGAPVSAYWRSAEWFQDTLGSTPVAAAVIGGTEMFFNSDRESEVTDDVIAHELAHSLGFRHGDDRGIVQPLTVGFTVGDKSPNEALKESTREVATTFDAYAYMEWTAADLGVVTTVYGGGDTRAVQVGHASTKYGEESDKTGMFFMSSFDGHGGRVTPGYRSDPDRIYTGHFYGLPTV